MPNQIDGNIKKCRVREVINLSDKYELEYYQDKIGNIYDGIIAGNKFVIETKPKLEEESDEKEEEKVYESEDNEQSSDSELSEKTFEGNMINS